MPNKTVRAYSQYCRQAVLLLGKHIQLARKERKFSERDLADRAGISRTTLQKVEKGDLKCEIGIFFELATLVGVKLFDVDLAQSRRLSLDVDHLEGKIALLPKSIRKSTKEVDDAF